MDNVKHLIACTLSSITSSIITHPIDVWKVRVQTNTKSPIYIAKQMLLREGVSSFYRGMFASMFRNGTFITSKMYTFDILKDRLKPTYFHEKLICGSIAGVVGSIVGTPFDLIMVRIQNNPTQYRNIYTTCIKTLNEEGFTSFWKGLHHNMARASIVTACQFGIYDHLKQELPSNVSNPYSRFFIASSVSSVISAIVSNPFDLCKIRRMNQHSNDTIKKIVNNEGLYALTKGMNMSIMRQIPLNMIRFSCLEAYKSILYK